MFFVGVDSPIFEALLRVPKRELTSYLSIPGAAISTRVWPAELVTTNRIQILMKLFSLNRFDKYFTVLQKGDPIFTLTCNLCYI